MKKKYKLLFAFIVLLSNLVKAQDGYTYTLVDNGSYSFTVEAVPNVSANNFATSVQSYGFTIILTDGLTITTSSSLGGAPSATFFDGTNVAQPTIDGYLVTETLGSPVSLTAPSAATNSAVYTFVVNGSPTSGSVSLLANDSPLATTVTPLKSFMQADMIDNGMAEFVNVVDPNASALSGITTYDFTVLSVDDLQIPEDDLFIYPMPAGKTVNISSIVEIISYTLYDLSGKLIDSGSISKQAIDTSKLASGIYIVKFKAENGNTIDKRLIKK